MKSPTEFTQLLQRAKAGDSAAHDAMFQLVYDELRGLARAIDASRGRHTLQPTAVVHEAWMKLARNLDGLDNRVHFVAVASMAMRQVLADHVRTRGRAKRGGAWEAITLHEDAAPDRSRDADLVDFSDCLEQLAALNERHARVVELRVLGGLTIAETAEAMGVSDFTVEADWSMARVWLWRRLAPTS